ncbi:MAG: hypothetical protein HZB15_11280 [Actinobacteria bacterium]|nr:hypothetical protein [Actinomycetota bacterium]
MTATARVPAGTNADRSTSRTPPAASRDEVVRVSRARSGGSGWYSLAGPEATGSAASVPVRVATAS